MASVHTIARLRECGEKVFRRQVRGCEFQAHLLTQMLEATLFWQKDQSIPQAQYGEWSARRQAEVLAKLFWDGQLTLFTYIGCGQVFESGVLS
jgi:hypothetical protein